MQMHLCVNTVAHMHTEKHIKHHIKHQKHTHKDTVHIIQTVCRKGEGDRETPTHTCFALLSGGTLIAPAPPPPADGSRMIMNISLSQAHTHYLSSSLPLPRPLSSLFPALLFSAVCFFLSLFYFMSKFSTQNQLKR